MIGRGQTVPNLGQVLETPSLIWFLISFRGPFPKPGFCSAGEGTKTSAEKAGKQVAPGSTKRQPPDFIHGREGSLLGINTREAGGPGSEMGRNEGMAPRIPNHAQDPSVTATTEH